MVEVRGTNSKQTVFGRLVALRQLYTQCPLNRHFLQQARLKMPNQYKPLRVFLSCLKLGFPHRSQVPLSIAPLDLVETHIRRYHAQGVSFDKMVPLLAKHYDTDSYGLGCVSFLFSLYAS